MNKYIEYFDQSIQQLQDEQKNLITEHRKDEAIFAKIQENVFNIFKSVLQAGIKSSENNKDALLFLEKRMSSIVGTWETALSAAKEHNNYQEIHIESLKLETAAQIRQNISKLQETVI